MWVWVWRLRAGGRVVGGVVLIKRCSREGGSKVVYIMVVSPGWKCDFVVLRRILVDAKGTCSL